MKCKYLPATMIVIFLVGIPSIYVTWQLRQVNLNRHLVLAVKSLKHARSAFSIAFAFCWCICVSCQKADAQHPKATVHQQSAARLFAAIEQDNIAGARELLAQGLDANSSDDQGRTAMMIAASRANIPLCRLLLEHGAELNRTDQRGNTALSVAVCQGGSYGIRPFEPIRPRPDEAAYIATARWLVANGSAINPGRKAGQNILLLAHFQLHDWTPLCEYLIRHGAEIEGRDRFGRCFLDYVAQSGNARLLALLLQKYPTQADKNSALLTAIGGTPDDGIVRLTARPQPDIARLLLAAGANPNGVDGMGYSLLHLAVYAQDRKTAQLLIEYGARVDVRHSKDGSSPLTTAVWLNDTAMQRLLRNAGATR
jgi:ankyrin repeat protein